MKKKILLLLLAVYVQTIEIPLKIDEATCMVIMSSFQPVKVDIKFPPLPNKKEGDQFHISLINVMTSDKESQQFVEDNSTFRKNYELQSNKLYEICIETVTSQRLKTSEILEISYSAAEDFEQRIGRIQIPQELSKQENLKKLYETGRKIQEVNLIIASHQQKQRELEDKLVGQNVHKNQRIVTLTLIECLVIILGGVYQIFALRKFLIDKNLY